MGLVSIVIPCYNQSEFLPDALETVLAQTYQDWECIIVNDGSPDDTGKIAQEWTGKDSRIKYKEKPNGGLASARNYGITHSAGEFILPLDADDKIGKDYLQLAINAFSNDDQLKLVYCRAELFGSEKGEWNLPPFKTEEILLFNTIFCSGIYRRSDFDQVGGYDERIKHGGEDWEFWISLLKNGGKVLKLDSIQFYYRKKENSMFTEIVNNEEKNLHSRKLIFQKHMDSYIRLLGDPITVYEKYYKLEQELSQLKKSKVYKALDSARKLKNRF